MKRAIIFRGRTEQGKWVFGDLEYRRISHVALIHSYENDGRAMYRGQTQVQNATIGQFTGLSDKNGKDIYEGDIVCMNTITGGVYYIAFEDSHIGAFSLCNENGFVGIFGRSADFEPFYCEVIGNIHDNPELLKIEK